MAMAAFTDIIVVVKEEEGPGDFWPDRPTNGDTETKPKASRTEQLRLSILHPSWLENRI